MRIEFSGGQRHDITRAPQLVHDDCEILIADTAYDSDEFRSLLEEKEKTCVIRPRATRKNPPPFDKTVYKRRHTVENFFCRIKQFRRVATRYDKTIESYAAFVFFSAVLLWAK